MNTQRNFEMKQYNGFKEYKGCQEQKKSLIEKTANGYKVNLPKSF